LMAWEVPGDSVSDPGAQAVLEHVRASESIGERPVWLLESAEGPKLATVRDSGAYAAVGVALAGTGIDASRIELYRGAYGVVLESAFQSFVDEPAAFVSTVSTYLPLLVLSSGAGFLLAALWFRRKRPVDGWEASAAERPAVYRLVAVGIGAGLVALAIGTPLAMITEWLVGAETLEQPIIRALSESSGIVFASFVLLSVVIAPLGEELFFRGHLFRWSASRCGLRYAYVLTAVFFALIHGNPLGIPVYVTFALLLGWVYERWRVVLVPIVAHATINGVQVAVAFIASVNQ